MHCINSATYDGDITANGTGISCMDYSDPVIGHCNIGSNGVGVFASDDSEPDLEGNGANQLLSNTTHHVVNLTSNIWIAAQGDYWYPNTGNPNYWPKAAKIYGNVDYDNALSIGPNPVSPGPEPKPERNPELVVTGLGRAHPNPFNPTIQIPYGVASPTDVQIDVFDVSGRLVRTLVSDRKARGNHVVVWDGTTNSGEPTASAVYFVRMRAGRLTETQKVVLLK